MDQRGKAFVLSLMNLEAYILKRKPTPTTCSLTSTQAPVYTYNKSVNIKNVKDQRHEWG